MWIVKTLGRRTRNGTDRVYSVNGCFITQELDMAAEEAIESFKDEVAGKIVTLPLLPMRGYTSEPRPQDRPEYWQGMWNPEWRR